jgi:branched-chain amino acid transport system ATP-binding protein
MNKVLSIDNVCAGYGGSPIIRDVSISAISGRITVVIGPNGAGKSTLLKTVAGILHCSAGSILMDGEEVQSLRTDQLVKRGLAYVPQTQDVFFSLNVDENLEMGGYLLPSRDLAARLESVFELFPQLAAKRKQGAGTLSGGERKMLAIGRVAMIRPKVLLLDEPTASLAPRVAEEILVEYVPQLARLGIGVLVVEQRVVEALSIADEVYVMVGGVVVASGPANKFLEGGEITDEIAGIFTGRYS